MNNNQSHEICQCPNCSNTSHQRNSITQIDIRITSYGERASLIRFPKKTSLICNHHDGEQQKSSSNNSCKEAAICRRMSKQSCDELYELRNSEQLCDVVVKCDDGVEFFAHKVILSAISRFFRALFTNGMNESRLDVVNISEIDSEIMKLIIDWSYTRNIVLDSSNIEKILPAADRFQLHGLTSKCIEFLIKSLHYENAIGIKKFASFYTHQLAIKSTCDNFIMENFLSIANSSQEFLELNLDELKSLILADELNIKKESNIFDVIIRWIDFNFNERRKHLPELIACLKLGYINKKYFIEKIKNHAYVKDQEDMKSVLADAIQFFIYSFNSNYVDLSDLRVRPRIPHELMFIVGGWSTGAPTNKIETFDPRADLWQLVDTNGFFPRAYHGCIFLNNYIYVIGGFHNLNYFNDCRRFNVVSRIWEEIAPMHVKRCYVSVATYKGIIYALGGFDGFLRQFSGEKYQPETNQWTLIAPMHEARSDASAAEIDGKIYICGGFNGIDCVDTAECYDPETNQWTLITSMLSRRSGVGVVAYKRAIYAIGGYNGIERLSTCERYDLKTREWTPLPQMYCPRSNFGVEVFDGCIFVIGGYNGSTTIENVESFDDEQNEWKLREKIKVNRSALSVCIVKGIEIVRPYSALKVERNLRQKRNFEFIRNLDNLSNSYYSYININ